MVLSSSSHEGARTQHPPPLAYLLALPEASHAADKVWNPVSPVHPRVTVYMAYSHMAYIHTWHIHTWHIHAWHIHAW